MNLKEKQEQYDAEKFLEDMGFELYEYQTHREISVFVKSIGNNTIFTSVRRGKIVEGNLLDE